MTAPAAPAEATPGAPEAPSTAAPAPSAPPQAPTPASDATSGQAPAAAQTQSGDGGEMFDRAYVERIRGEAAQHRTEKASLKATLDAIAKAISPEASAADPAKLADQLADSQRTARDNAVKLAVYMASGASGADPAALLDSNSFMSSLKDVDPSDSAAIASAIAAAVQGNARLKATQAAAASGTSQAGGSGETGQITEAQLASMTPEQIAEAHAKGQLAHLL